MYQKKIPLDLNCGVKITMKLLAVNGIPIFFMN